MDCSLSDSSTHGILQARILGWVAILFSRGSSWPRDWTWVSCLVGGFFTSEPPEKHKETWEKILVKCIITMINILNAYRVLTNQQRNRLRIWTFYVCAYIHVNIVVQSLSCVQLFVTSSTAACQASLSFTISQCLLKLMFIELVMPSNHLVLCRPLLLLPSIFPSIRVFSN